MKTRTKRKRHSAAFNAKVGMEAVIGIKTVAQIAREYSVHPVRHEVVREERADEFTDRFARQTSRMW